MAQPQSRLDYVIVTLPLIIIIFGLIGNIFSVAVLLRAKFRKRSISVYLITLAVLDSIFLLSSHPVAWAGDILFGVQYQSVSDTACALSNYIMGASRTISAWILVVLSMERMLAMSIPHLAVKFSSRKRALIGTTVVVLFISGIYTFSFFVYAIYPNGNCYWTVEVESSKIHMLLNAFDFIIYMVIPSTIMATCNSALLFMLYYSREVKQRSEADNKNIVVTIVLVTMAFIILTSPMCLNNLIFLAGVSINPPDYLYTVLYSLDLLNHAINFILYSLSGPTFRKEIKGMFCCEGCSGRGRKNNFSKSASMRTASTIVDLDSKDALVFRNKPFGVGDN